MKARVLPGETPSDAFSRLARQCFLQLGLLALPDVHAATLWVMQVLEASGSGLPPSCFQNQLQEQVRRGLVAQGAAGQCATISAATALMVLQTAPLRMLLPPELQLGHADAKDVARRCQQWADQEQLRCDAQAEQLQSQELGHACLRLSRLAWKARITFIIVAIIIQSPFSVSRGVSSSQRGQDDAGSR